MVCLRDMHACIYVAELAENDLSCLFIYIVYNYRYPGRIVKAVLSIMRLGALLASEHKID